MIASLTGKIQEKSLQRVVVDVGGVGYLVHVSMQTLAELPAAGEAVQILCHTHVREDALQIFGFLAPQEQQMFELLIGVSGIGPRLALTILSGMRVGDVAEAITAGDHRRLQSIPGVGKKTAERVVVELKDRCDKLGMVPAAGPGPAPAPARGDATEVADALVTLGYRRPAAEKVVAQVIERAAGASLAPEELLRAALAAMTER